PSLPCLRLLRRPPRPPLFPYTTLFRSRLGHRRWGGVSPRLVHPLGVEPDSDPVLRLQGADQLGRGERGETLLVGHQGRPYGEGRSEEHTSELQSRENLVCRLLLEKKKC